MDSDIEVLKTKLSSQETISYLQKNANLGENEKIFSNNRNLGNRIIIRAVIEKKYVLNRILTIALDDVKFKEAIKVDHENVEKVLCWFKGENFHYFITPLFVCKLKTVWEETSQFVKFDVKKMFLDFFEGLLFFKTNKIVHTTIHSDNMAFNGTNWYISGLVTAKKAGECMSGVYNIASLKSRRFELARREIEGHMLILSENLFVPSDDLWQLILLYVTTYYGYNPFRSCTKIQDYEKWSSDFSLDCTENIIKGFCQDITVTDQVKSFGEKLQQMLLNRYENSYDEFKKIILENNEENITDLLNGDAVCIICYANKKQVTFFPCQHNITCFPCAKKITKNKSANCPFCRQHINGWS